MATRRLASLALTLTALFSAAGGAVMGTTAAGAAAEAMNVRAAESTATARIGHAYRHGLIGRRARAATRIAASGATGLVYFGGQTAPGYSNAVGVTTGAPKVYLVFWGSQWGSTSTNSDGDTVLSGDPRGIAPILQAFFRGIGTGDETWSGVMTQYCEGITPGSNSCSGGVAHVGYPTGGALAGVWVDSAHAAPSAASGHALAAEAVAASTHFANLDAASNRSAQYVIVSPTGTNPDQWLDPTNGYCAWHDYSADSTLTGGAATSPNGAVAFTNLPYLPDAGGSCGAGFVNAPGIDDGVTLVGGHEYAETITDQFPSGGWLDAHGQENADKCSWIATGPGASRNVTFTTGTFPVQSTWSNDAGACQIAHSIYTATPPTITSSNGATFVVSKKQSFTITTDVGTAATVTASGALPTGVIFVPTSTGAKLSGTPAIGSIGTYPITITATSFGLATHQSFTFTVAPKRAFTSAKKATFVHGSPSSFSVVVVGAFNATTSGTPVVPSLSVIGVLPSGIMFIDNGNGTATLSGTAMGTGKFPITLVATGDVVATQKFQLTVV